MESLRKIVDSHLEQFNQTAIQIESEKNSIQKCSKKIEHLGKAQKILQVVAQSLQQSIHTQIAQVVTKCLESVFDDPYSFRIDFERKRGHTEAKLVLSRDGLDLEDPLEEAGGAVVDIASLALRLSCLLLARPKRRRVLFLDEPFRFVYEDNKPRVVLMLRSLAQEMGFQIVFITHDSALRCGKIINLR